MVCTRSTPVGVVFDALRGNNLHELCSFVAGGQLGKRFLHQTALHHAVLVQQHQDVRAILAALCDLRQELRLREGEDLRAATRKTTPGNT